MRARIAQYTNDIVSLTVLALLSIALIAAQAGAAQNIASEPADSEVEHVLILDSHPDLHKEGE